MRRLRFPAEANSAFAASRSASTYSTTCRHYTHRVVSEQHEDAGAPFAAPCKAHVDKLIELLANAKLPATDVQHVERALDRHADWIGAMDALDAEGAARVEVLVVLLNDYKRSVELDLIWDSEHDFLWRQRGQLKIDNSILEEFLPRLVDARIIPALKDTAYEAGPQTAFAATYFATTLTTHEPGAGLTIRTKAQDFTVGRRAYVRSSRDPGFAPADTATHTVFLAFVAAECKTNLDKTMFQEASATAHDLKVAIPGSRYYLLCEWLDMTPIATAGTDIDEVLILRGKRLASNVRAKFASAAERVAQRDWYEEFLTENAIRIAPIERFVGHLESLFEERDPDEGDVLTRGYF